MVCVAKIFSRRPGPIACPARTQRSSRSPVPVASLEQGLSAHHNANRAHRRRLLSPVPSSSLVGDVSPAQPSPARSFPAHSRMLRRALLLAAAGAPGRSSWTATPPPPPPPRPSAPRSPRRSARRSPTPPRGSSARAPSSSPLGRRFRSTKVRFVCHHSFQASAV